MKYTKKQLQGMSDLEVNQALTAMVLGNPWLEFGELVNDGKEFHVANAIGEPFYCAVIDYCNNPSDIMPLAFEHGVGVMPYDIDEDSEEYLEYKDVWFSQKGVLDHEQSFDCKNPLRAIACCLILVLQERKP